MPRSARTGRRTKLTPEVQETVVKYLKAGLYAEQVCAIAGISEATFYAWQARGRKALEALEALGEDEDLDALTVKELKQVAADRGIPVSRTARKGDLIDAILDANIPETELPFVEFLEATKRADGEAEMRALLEIQKAGKDTWQANAWFLERRHKDRWAKERPVEQATQTSDVDAWLKHMKGGAA